MGVSIKIGKTLKMDGFSIENPVKMDDLEVKPPIFGSTPIFGRGCST